MNYYGAYSFRAATENDLQRLISYLDSQPVGKGILGELEAWATLEADNVSFLSMDDMLNHFDEHIWEGVA